MDAFRLVKLFSDRVTVESNRRNCYLSTGQVALIGQRILAECYEALGPSAECRDQWLSGAREVICGAVGTVFLKQFPAEFDVSVHAACLARSMLLFIKENSASPRLSDSWVSDLEQFESLPSVLRVLREMCDDFPDLGDVYTRQVEVVGDFHHLKAVHRLHHIESAPGVPGFGVSG